VYLTLPLKGFPLEFGIGARSNKSLNDGLPDGRKSFKIGCRLDTIPAVTDSHLASQPRRLYRAMLRVGKNLNLQKLI